MGRTFRRDDEDYTEAYFRESRKEAKIKKRKDREHQEDATYEERHG